MVIVTCSDDGGDCETKVNDFDGLRNGKYCPGCDSKFSHRARKALRNDDSKSSVQIQCDDEGGDCGTLLESFSELENGKKCPICDSVLTYNARNALMS